MGARPLAASPPPAPPGCPRNERRNPPPSPGRGKITATTRHLHIRLTPAGRACRSPAWCRRENADGDQVERGTAAAAAGPRAGMESAPAGPAGRGRGIVRTWPGARSGGGLRGSGLDAAPGGLHSPAPAAGHTRPRPCRRPLFRAAFFSLFSARFSFSVLAGFFFVSFFLSRPLAIAAPSVVIVGGACHISPRPHGRPTGRTWRAGWPPANPGRARAAGWPLPPARPQPGPAAARRPGATIPSPGPPPAGHVCLPPPMEAG